MKLKNIAKASLALGILTTGMITTTAQPVKASEQSRLSVTSNDTQELKKYYNRPFFEYTNQS
ncbi:superantigen-like protein, partial [Staphylococcus aureus]|nr:superantigen-like protein [Staphylococcus aureus]